MRTPVLVVWLAVLGVSIAGLPGCSAYLSATKPGRKDMTVFALGTPRRVIIGELGLPEESARSDDGTPIDIWNFARATRTG